MRPNTYAPDESAVRASETVVRDTRGIFERLGDASKERANTGRLMLILAVVCVFFPGWTELVLLVGGLALSLGMWLSRFEVLPMRLPATSGLTDYHDPKPGRRPGKRGFERASGTFFLGNARGYMPLWWDTILRRCLGRSFEEVWASSRDVLTHLLVLGSTGAGKTEALLSYSWNYLTMGAGLIYGDAKAAPKLAMQIYRMARMVGRDDDCRFLNYFTGTARKTGDERLGNTMNPFTHGSAESLSQLLQGLIPTSEGENAIFSEKAVALINSLMYALEEKRDRNEIVLSPASIAEYLSLEKCYDITRDESLSERSRTSMRTFLSTSVGFELSKPLQKQGEEVARQFSFAQAYFTRALLSLSDTYGHIFNVPYGEVDYPDVVRNRRILAILLPAMEKPPQELLNLGKINLTGLRNAMAEGLGDGIEGTVVEVLDGLPTASNVPTALVIDEYPYIATKGFAIAAAQGRGLFVSAAFGGQDIAGFERADKEEAEQIVANTNIKYLMKLDDPSKTWDLFKNLAGEMYVTESAGYQIGQGIGALGYADQMSANIQQRSRISIRDAQEQIEGEAHLFSRGEITRIQVFHAGVSLPKDAELRILRHVVVVPPGFNHVLRAQPTRTLLNTLHQITAYRPAVEMCVDSDEAALVGAFAELSNAGTRSLSPRIINVALRAHALIERNEAGVSDDTGEASEEPRADEPDATTDTDATSDEDGQGGGQQGGGNRGLSPDTVLGDLGGVVDDAMPASPLVAVFLQQGQWTWGDDDAIVKGVLGAAVPAAMGDIAGLLRIEQPGEATAKTLSDLIGTLVYSLKPIPGPADEPKMAAAVLQQMSNAKAKPTKTNPQ